MEHNMPGLELITSDKFGG